MSHSDPSNLDPSMLQHKQTWKISTSSGNRPEAIADGDTNTEWTTHENGPQWVEIDLVEPASLAGFEILWGWNACLDFRIETSLDGLDWVPAAETPHGECNLDVLPFSVRQARYVRLWTTESMTQGGYGIREVFLFGPEDSPRVRDQKYLHALDFQRSTAASLSPGSELVVEFGRLRDIGGLRLEWADTHVDRYRVEVSEDSGTWATVGEIVNGTGGYDNFYWTLRKASSLRVVSDAAASVGEIRELKLRFHKKEYTPLALLESAASQHPVGVYPTALRLEQVYWTVLGTPDDDKEALFDEWGNVEPWMRGPTLMFHIRHSGRLWSARDDASTEHRMEGGSRPVCSVRWRAGSIEVEHEAFADPEALSCPLTGRVRLTNSSSESVDAELVASVQPLQVNPEWQHGGLATIGKIETSDGWFTVDARPFAQLLPVADAAWAAAFSDGTVLEGLAAGVSEGASEATCAKGLASAAMVFRVNLLPGESREVEWRAPFLPNDPLQPSGSFEDRRSRTLKHWDRLLGPARIAFPEPSLTDTLESQAVYTLINQNGPALQPGSRNYDRTWMRDGAAHAVLLMQRGLFERSRSYLEWYAQSIYENGLIPPILNKDGSVNTGFGSNLEHDSQGQFLYAVAEHYRFSRDKGCLNRMFPKVVAAMRFLQELRERTLHHPVDSGFHGILAPSISHEGYSKPIHSYWDDYFGLKGWEEGAFLAQEIGDGSVKEWAVLQRQQLAESLKQAIRSTVQRFGLNYIPSSSDLGDFDPTSTSIAFHPCQAEDALPSELLAGTYDRYMNQVSERFQPDWRGRFTPYEIRNINALAAMGRSEDAHRLLDYLIGCRRPSGWNHWAEVIIGDKRLADYIGDMPHTWIGAEFSACIRFMVVQERDDALHLLPHTPLRWLEGDGLRLTDYPTHFGLLDLTARWDGALQLEYNLKPDSHPIPVEVVIGTPQGAGQSEPR